MALAGLEVNLYFCCDCFRPRPDGFAIASSASETPATIINSPIKTRGLRNADCVADFFFISFYRSGDGLSARPAGSGFLSEASKTCQHYCQPVESSLRCLERRRRVEETVVASGRLLISGCRLYTFDAGIAACSTAIVGSHSVKVSRVRT